MAKAKSNGVKASIYNAKALVHIKYDKENYKPGDEFEVRESDAEELKVNGYAKVSETPIKEEINPDNAQESGENGGE